MALTTDLENMLKPAIEDLGYDFFGLDFFPQGKKPIVRIYIDRDQGVKVADCEKVSRRVSSLLDVEAGLNSAYTLEVSSPGLERKLFTAEQCEKQVGQTLKVRLRHESDGKKNFKGKLLNVNGNELKLDIDGSTLSLDFQEIEKAQVVLN